MKRFVNHVINVIAVLFLVLFCDVVAVGASNVLPFPIDELKDTESGNYQWPKVSFGMSINEVEEALECEFPEILFNSDYQERVMKLTEPAIDYRTDTSYYCADFIAYKDGEPLFISYQDAVGYLICEFQYGKLIVIRVTFGDSPLGNDKNYDFDGNKNDLDLICEQMKKDLEEIYGITEDGHTDVVTGEWVPEWYSDRIDDFYTELSVQKYNFTDFIIIRRPADKVEEYR